MLEARPSGTDERSEESQGVVDGEKGKGRQRQHRWGSMNNEGNGEGEGRKKRRREREREIGKGGRKGKTKEEIDPLIQRIVPYGLVNCAAYGIIHWYRSALPAQSQWNGGYRTHRRQSRHGAHRNLPVSYEVYHTVLYRLRLCMAYFFLLFVEEGGGGSTSSRVSQPTGCSTAVKGCRQRMPSKNIPSAPRTIFGNLPAGYTDSILSPLAIRLDA